MAAIDAMDIKVGSNVQPTPRPRIDSGYEVLFDTFGDQVYIDMRNGALHDPLTGQWGSLAFGEKCGWRIRGEGDSYKKWLKIGLPQLNVDGLDVSASMDGVGERLAACTMAAVKVADLLERPEDKFFLPRKWNEEGVWITKEALKSKYDQYLAEKAKGRIMSQGGNPQSQLRMQERRTPNKLHVFPVGLVAEYIDDHGQVIREFWYEMNGTYYQPPDSENFGQDA